MSNILIALGAVIIGSFVFSRNPRVSTNRIFYFLMITVALWSFIEFQLSISIDGESYLFWADLDIIYIFTIMVLFHFTLVFTNSLILLKNKYMHLLIYGIAILGMCFDYVFVVNSEPVLINGFWYSDFSGIAEILNNGLLAIFSSFALFALVICIRYFINNKDKRIRKQTLYILAGLAIPVIGGIFTDVILNSIFLYRTPLGTIHFIAGTILFFSYAIWRYDVFSIDIETAADNIVSTMSDALFLVDKNKNIKMVNNTAQKLTGYWQKELLGQSINSILNNNKQINTFLDNNLTAKDVDTALKTKYGTIVPVSISCSVIKDKLGVEKGYVIICRDITERKKAEEEMTKLATVIKHSGELVNLATLDGRMIFLNEAGGKMLGITPENAKQYTITEVIPNHLKTKVEKELLPTLMNEGCWEGELQYINIKNGKTTDVHAMTFIITDPLSKQPLYLANVSLDITKQKQSEKKVKQTQKVIWRLCRLTSKR